MVRNQSEKDRARDKRYQQKYRIDLNIYNQIGEKQGWRCGACGRPASDFTVSLNVDHFHFRITLKRDDPPTGWIASTAVRGRTLAVWGKTQAKAKAALLDVALPLSIRGLLCPGRYSGCNRLMGRIDKIDWLEKVLVYLKNPPAHAIIS